MACFASLVYFLTTFNCYFNEAITAVQLPVQLDQVSFLMVLLLFVVLYASFLLTTASLGSFSMFFVFLRLLLFCYEVFTTSHLFVLYFCFEASLVPIVYIIVK